MRLLIKDYFEQFSTSLKNFAVGYFGEQKADLFSDIYYDVMSEFAYKGDEYIYDGDSVDDCVNVLTEVHQGLLLSNRKFFASMIDNTGKLVGLSPDDIVSNQYSSEGNGMSENSPINANIGEINTPNAKTKSSTVGDTTWTKSLFDNYLRKFRMEYETYNIYDFVRNLFIQLVYHHNVIM